MVAFTVNGDNVSLEMFTKCDVPSGVATEVLGLMYFLNGAYMYSYDSTPEWSVVVRDDSLEVHTQVNRIDVNLDRRW